jgi:hypothetical protein
MLTSRFSKWCNISTVEWTKLYLQQANTKPVREQTPENMQAINVLSGYLYISSG